MLSSRMIPSHHPTLPSLPKASTAHFRFSREGSDLVGKGHQFLAPARRGEPARPYASSVFSATSALSVLIPALSPKNPSFVLIRLRTLANSVHLFYSRPLSCPLFSYSCALFCTQEKRNSFIFRRFRTLCAKHGRWGEGGSLGLSYQRFSSGLSRNWALMLQSPCFAFRFSNALSRRFPEPFGLPIRIPSQVPVDPGSVGVAHNLGGVL